LLQSPYLVHTHLAILLLPAIKRLRGNAHLPDDLQAAHFAGFSLSCLGPVFGEDVITVVQKLGLVRVLDGSTEFPRIPND
jgi:hypothetical protein